MNMTQLSLLPETDTTPVKINLAGRPPKYAISKVTRLKSIQLSQVRTYLTTIRSEPEAAALFDLASLDHVIAVFNQQAEKTN